MLMEHHCLQNNPDSLANAPSSSSPNKLDDTKRSQSTRNVKTRGRRSGLPKLSTDPQSVAARRRRHRISDRFKILQSLVPGGSKMDTVSMLEEAIHYVKFLKAQICLHHAVFEGRAGWPDFFLASSAALPPVALQWAEMAKSQADSVSSSFMDGDHHAATPPSNLADLGWFQAGEETVSCDEPPEGQSLP